MRRIILLASCFLLSFASSMMLPWGTGEVEPIGKFLNETFPVSTPGAAGSWLVVDAFPGLTFVDPLQMVEIPNEEAYFVAGKRGKIWKFSSDTTTTEKIEILDIESQVYVCDDCGFLELVLHPEFNQPGSPNRGYLYVFYRYTPDENTSGDSYGEAYVRLSRFTIPDGSEMVDPNSEYVLIQQFDRQGWHSGGSMLFDEEGYLYVSLGDEGGTQDQYNSGQQIHRSFFSGILRIDVDMDPSRSHPIRRQPSDPDSHPAGWEPSFTQGYYIPNDNPWQDPDGGILEEFYAIGLRSPHRMAMDRQTGLIWVGDVGQGAREEVTVVGKGENHQWPFLEGTRPGPKSRPDEMIGVEKGPIYEYGRNVGSCIIGGFKYHGDLWPSLYDKYIYADFTTRDVYALTEATDTTELYNQVLTKIPPEGSGVKTGLSSFATDSKGEIYFLKLYGLNLDGGKIYKLSQGPTYPEPPQYLSQTGAFTDLATLETSPGIIPYKTNAPLWSDGSAKQRWVAIPNDGDFDSQEEKVQFREDDFWRFPEGTVFIKHFELPLDPNDPSVTTRLETRFFILGINKTAYGVTYRWNEDQTDAELLFAEEFRDIPVIQPDGSALIQRWNFPSREQCMNCHNQRAGYVLGVQTNQLNGLLTYPETGMTVNQLEAWHEMGIFSDNFQMAELEHYPKAYPLDAEEVSRSLRIQSYMDSNCSHCHFPGGVQGAFDARFGTPLSQKNMLNAATVSLNSAHNRVIIAPGDTLNSEQYLRDNAAGVMNAMPPLAKNIVDTAFIDLLAEWINSMPYDYQPACEENLYTYVSDLEWAEEPSNGWGEIQVDPGNNARSFFIEEDLMMIRGKSYEKGLKVHANSTMIYDLDDATGYEYLLAEIGIDDNTCNQGSVVFEVFGQNLEGGEYKEELLYTSPVLRQSDDPLPIKVEIVGYERLRLRVDDADDGRTCDHADWADLRLEITCERDLCMDGPAATISPRDWSLRVVDSEEASTDELAHYAFDDNPLTHWHTEWVNTSPELPHQIEIDLGGIYSLEGFRYLPRADGVLDGAVEDYSLLISRDAKEWTTVQSGRFSYDDLETSAQEIQFEAVVGRYVRFRAESELSGNPWTSIAELDMIGNICEELPIGEVGLAMANDNWQRVQLDHEYVSPVVVLGAISAINGSPARAMIRNVQTSSFELKVDGWACTGEGHTHELVPYMVMEEGSYELQPGKRVVASKIRNLKTTSRRVSFPQAFIEKPVVLVQEIGNETNEQLIRVQANATNTEAFQLEALPLNMADFTATEVGWIAIETGLNEASPRMEIDWVEVNAADWQSLAFQQNYSDNRILFAALNSGSSSFAANLRYDHQQLNGQSGQLRLESADCEAATSAEEMAGYLIFDRPGFIHQYLKDPVNNSPTHLIVKAYPNPTTGIFTLEAFLNNREIGEASINIYNPLGQLIYQRERVVPILPIDLSREATGVYLIEVKVNGLSKTVRLLKE